MAYIIGIILVIIALIIVGLILRKRVYDVVDRQESWKMEIMNRNVAEELQRIKSLNMSGEAQEKFEAWKERWESIITQKLPDIEEYLFDAETAADKYRFPTAKKVLRNSEEVLQSIEKEISELLQELDELLQFEETTRVEVEQIEPDIKALKKQLSQYRYQYGEAEAHFEETIDGLNKQLTNYYELTNAGDYYEAQQVVETLKLELETLQQQMEEFPELYKACKQELPSQLNELSTGIKEMKQEGYHVEHLGFEKEIHNFKSRLSDCVQELNKADTTEARVIVPELEERIQEMYALLEKEAIAKNYIKTQKPNYQGLIKELDDSFQKTKEDVEALKQTYYFEDSDMEKYLTLDQAITKLKNQLNEWSSEEEDDRSYTEIRERIEEGFQQIESLQSEHEAFKKRVYNLRKDEIEAKEKLADIQGQLHNTIRRLTKSNIPGIPSFIWNLKESADAKNKQVLQAMERQPLDITEVQQALDETKKVMDTLVEKTDLVLDQAYLTEQVIQYANRYRSKYPLLAGKLSEAERLFRSYEYELSLEQAAKALEEIEPGALKRIEAFQAEMVH